jgi:hypothetical protein
VQQQLQLFTNCWLLFRLVLAALGMNEEELKANKQVTEYVVHDLNTLPLPFK